MKLVRPFFLTFLIIISVCGCASVEFSTIKQSLVSPNYPGHYIKDILFIKQDKFACGPAALATVLRYHQIDISQQEISKELYIPKIKGSLNFEMAFFAQRFGLFSESYSGDFPDLKSKISSDIPVIVLVRNLPLVFEQYHYIVVSGFDDSKKVLIANTGVKENVLIPYKIFFACWRNANNWMLVICPPEKVNWALTHQEYNKLGNFYEKKQDFDKAITNYNEALRLKPNTPEYFFNLGNVYLKKGLFDEAKRYFENALAMDPNFSDCLNNLSCVYLEKDQELNKAQELVNKAITLNPQAKAYYLDTLALIQTHRGVFDEAVVTFKKAIELVPKDDPDNLSTIYYHLATAQYKNGQIDDTKASLNESLKISPNGPMSVEAKLLLEKIKSAESQ